MSSGKLRVIILTHGGVELALARLLDLECVEVAGIFIETDTIRRLSLREKVRRSLRYDGYATTAAKFGRKLLGLNGIYDDDIKAIAGSRDRLRDMAQGAGVPVHLVSNYHDDDALALMRAAAADLGIVLGTNILKEPVFSIPRLGSINLHQGLAPYYRGCPPVFWELFNGEREVGLTVHFVASKVDTGDIVLQRTVPLLYDYGCGLDYERFIGSYRQKLIQPCANLVAEAVELIARGLAAPRPQDPTLGKRYRMPVKREKDELRRRLRERRRAPATQRPQAVSSGD